MSKLNIFVIGGGGREHALVWKIAQSPLVSKIYCAPGNPGISELAECVDISPTDLQGLLALSLSKKIDLTVVGPEVSLVAGIVDLFEEQGLGIFGPSRAAAELEGSKVFAKYLLKKYDIPTADYKVLESFDDACAYLKTIPFPTVIKADGLAAGKGALICKTEHEAIVALEMIMVDRQFGEAGSRVVVEEFMQGEEASVIAFTDGEDLAYLPPAQDHKPVFDGDQGPNTGGMGAYAPAPVVDAAMMRRIHREIMLPTVKAMALEGRVYRGVLYAGLMVTKSGPKVVEFNCRFGDPEAQVLLPLINADLVDTLFRISRRKRIDDDLKLYSKWAMCVVLASGGYPGSYETGKRIVGLDGYLGEDTMIFHAGTGLDPEGRVITAAGRVLGITATGDDFYSARKNAYSAVGKVAFDKAYYRKDIGEKAKRHL